MASTSALYLSVLGFAALAASTASASDYRISGPFTQDNLSIFLIHGKSAVVGKKLVTLQEAMDRKLVAVYETGNVSELSIENLSSEDVYIQSGDIVKGGRQDRVLPEDFILPSHSGKVPISSLCVESGRWSKRSGEAADRFSASNLRVATKDLKLAVRGRGEQAQVWAAVARTQEKVAAASGIANGAGLAAASPTSMQLALENSKVTASTDAYVRALSKAIDGQTDVVGYVFAVNGKIAGADTYASSELFRKLWPKLLQASAVEALAERSGAKPSHPLDPGAVKAILNEAERGRQSSKDVAKRLQVVTTESDKAMLFETRDREAGGGWVHRSLIVK